VITVYRLKPAFQALLRPLVRRLHAAAVTPNQVTLFALLGSVALGSLLALAPGRRALLLAVPAWLLVRMALNAIDGMLAREHDMRTPFGLLLNEIGDVLADAALYLPLALVAGTPALVVTAVVLAVTTEVAGLGAVAVGAPRRHDGPMGKSDRAVAFGTLALLLGAGTGSGWWLEAALLAVNALLCLTIANRLVAALEELRP